MSDQTDYSNTNNSIDDCDDSQLCNIPRKKMKLSSTKERNARSLTENIKLESQLNSWKFIDRNETMIAELSGGKLTLWQFLLELLMNNDYSSLIRWTDRNMGEFILIQAEEVAKLWGIRKDRNHRMNYDKLSRALRYYYRKNIIKKVHGHKFVYRFVSLIPDPEVGSESSQWTIPTWPKDSKLTAVDNSRHTSTKLSSMITNNDPMKSDLNSTLTALFQAALFSLSGASADTTQTIFPNLKQSKPSDNNDVHAAQPSPAFDHCPRDRLTDRPTLPTFPSSIPVPQFNRQSMVHFNRHSINMQRLSQEILLQATSKSRFNPCLSPTITADTLQTPKEQTNLKMWKPQFCPTDLHKPTGSLTGDHSSFSESISNCKPTTNRITPTEVTIKTEAVVPKEDKNTLTTLFNKFISEFNITTSGTPESTNGEPLHDYSSADLANLIKSQLSSQSSFVWMPVPVHFATEIMNISSRSSLD